MPVDGRNVQRNTRTRFDDVVWFAENVRAAHARAFSAWCKRHRIAGTDASLHQRSGHDGTETRQRKHAIDRQIERCLGIALRERSEGLCERGAQFVESGAGMARYGDRGCAAGESAAQIFGNRFASDAEFVAGKQIDFREGDDRAANVEITKNVEVLARLRHYAFVGVDHQQEHVHSGGAGEHIVQEAFVTGNVDDSGFDSIVENEVRESQIERHAAQPFFQPTIRIGSGQRRNE